MFSRIKPGRRTPARASRQMHISKEGDRYLRTMMCKGHTIFWAFGEIVICGDGDCDLRSTEGKMPRTSGLLRWQKVGGLTASVVGEWRGCTNLRNNRKAMRAVPSWRSSC